MEDFFQLFWLGFVDLTSFAYAITSMGIAFAATDDNRVFAYELSGYTAFLLGVRSVAPYATMTKIGWRCLV